MSKNNKVSINLDKAEVEILESLAKKQGISINEAFKRAAILATFIHNQREKGNKILIEQFDWVTKELTFDY